MTTTAESAGAGEAVPARPVREGDDLVAAEDAVAEIHHFDGSVTRLDAGSAAAIGRLADPDGRPHVVLRLGVGAAWHCTGPHAGRHAQYEAHTPAATALARIATFVTRCAADHAAWFAVLSGTVVVRGRHGGTVVLQTGESVTVAPDGTMGEVARPGADALGADEWVAVNEALDAADTPPADPPPAPRPDVSAVDVSAVDVSAVDVSALNVDAVHVDAVDVEPPAPRRDDHPWRVGVAAVLAIGLGIFSVVIGRSTSHPSQAEAERGPGIAVPGPPAFSGPALTASTAPPVETADTPPRIRRTPTSAPAATVPAAPAPATSPSASAPSAPLYEVAGRSCARRAGGGVAYSGSVTNNDAVARGFVIEVLFVDAEGARITATDVTVADVAPGTTRTFSTSVSRAPDVSSCELGAVRFAG